MAQTSFEIDDKTAEALESLKKVYGVSSNAAVLRRALAIALGASKHADEHHNIHVLRKGEDGKEREVMLPQRF
jgi:ribbon-helix-helix CopG family protein